MLALAFEPVTYQGLKLRSPSPSPGLCSPVRPMIGVVVDCMYRTRAHWGVFFFVIELGDFVSVRRCTFLVLLSIDRY